MCFINTVEYILIPTDNTIYILGAYTRGTRVRFYAFLGQVPYPPM